MSIYKDEKATQIFNSLLKKYIPDNSKFETWFSQPYDDNERVDVFIEYSFDSNDTRFWKTDVQEDDEPQRYEGTIYLLINRLMIFRILYHSQIPIVWVVTIKFTIKQFVVALQRSF